MYNKFIKYCTYPLWTIKDGNIGIYRYLREYRNYNSLSYSELRQRQLRNLKNILSHAYAHCGYYRELFDRAGFSVQGFESAESMREIPILTKEAIRANLPALLADNMDRGALLEDRTGGSSGVPLLFYRDKRCIQKRRAQELFFDAWMGYEIGDKIGLFVAARHMPAGIQGWRRIIRNKTSNRILAFDPSHIDESYLKAFLARFRRYRPGFLKCFPNSLYVFASYLKKNGIDDLQAKCISCTGETLHDHQKQLFQEVFRCPVFEKYASFEAGVAACECREHDGMHIFLDGVYLEFLDDRNEPARPGEMANIVVTDLFNYGMPFIRYKIGDIGIYTAEKCKCGSNLPLLKKLFGRDRDILQDENGNLKPGYLFVEVFNKNNIPGKFQVIQESRQKVRIRIVRMPEYNDDHANLIGDKFREILGKTIGLEFEYVPDIPREASGKYLYVHSKISPFL